MILKGKRIVLLGGSSGIGLATAQAAGAEGALVVIASSRKTRVDDALATLPADAEGHVLDLADETAVQALFATLGDFDHLVFTAGETLQLGSLANTAGKRPHAGWALGASICSAMEGLTRALAVELAPIRVNIVCPGVVKSPLWAAMTEPDRAALYRQTAEKLPVGHVGETAEIAEAYLYLIRQTYGTGQVVVVDGGAALV
jgi:NAD(P)-dependent dehydrogenase (short-subunit alcohol dehydrogenase family)